MNLPSNWIETGADGITPNFPPKQQLSSDQRQHIYSLHEKSAEVSWHKYSYLFLILSEIGTQIDQIQVRLH